MNGQEGEFQEYKKALEEHYEKEYEEFRLSYLLAKLSVADIYLGEWVNVWVEGEEDPELEDALEGGMEVNEALAQIKARFSTHIMIWIRERDEEGTAYYLLPRFFAYHGSKQFVIQQCGRCGSWLGTARICNSTKPWDCAHNEIIYCALCGAESGWVEGGIHGGHGFELNEGEVDLLLKFFKKNREDDEGQ